MTSIFHHSRNRWSAWLAAAIVGIAAQSSLDAAPVKTPHVEAELISENATLAAGESATVALRLRIEEGWHTYWRNPGDSGLPTTLDWKLPPGFRAGAIEWTAPKALPVGPLVNYGYDGTVLHLVKLEVPADLKPGSTVDLAARADWLVCKETCIPDGAGLTLALPVAEHTTGDPRWSRAIDAARAALPQPLKGGWHTEARGDGQKIILTLAPPAGAPDPGEMRFFANTERQIEPSAPQSLARSA